MRTVGTDRLAGAMREKNEDAAYDRRVAEAKTLNMNRIRAIVWHGPSLIQAPYTTPGRDGSGKLWDEVKLARRGDGRLATLARHWGHLTAREGRKGGWVYDTFTDSALTHGWDAYSVHLKNDGLIADDPTMGGLAYFTDKAKRIMARVAALIELDADWKLIRDVELCLRRYSYTGRPEQLTTLGQFILEPHGLTT